ncbi:hypothetical protein EDD15DRAFT_2260206 [Pisolithus albus]|nr:hypothetical protein EDD15DRAFT_2260206 [Pisolithus albus]
MPHAMIFMPVIFSVLLDVLAMFQREPCLLLPKFSARMIDHSTYRNMYVMIFAGDGTSVTGDAHFTFRPRTFIRP